MTYKFLFPFFFSSFSRTKLILIKKVLNKMKSILCACVRALLCVSLCVSASSCRVSVCEAVNDQGNTSIRMRAHRHVGWVCCMCVCVFVCVCVCVCVCV